MVVRRWLMLGLHSKAEWPSAEWGSDWGIEWGVEWGFDRWEMGREGREGRWVRGEGRGKEGRGEKQRVGGAALRGPSTCGVVRRWGFALVGLRVGGVRADEAQCRWSSTPMGLHADGAACRRGCAPMRLCTGRAAHR